MVLARAVVPDKTFGAATTPRPDLPLPTGVAEYQNPINLTPDTAGGSELRAIRRRGMGKVGHIEVGHVVPGLIRPNRKVIEEGAHRNGARDRLPGDLTFRH